MRVRNIILVFYYMLLCFFLNPNIYSLDPYEKSAWKRKLTNWVPGNHNSALLLSIKINGNSGRYKSWILRKARSGNKKCYAFRLMNKRICLFLIGSGTKIENIVYSAWKGPKRVQVVNVRERWFNKPSKISKTGEKKEKSKANWSSASADMIRKNIKSLENVLAKPNSFNTISESGSSEIDLAAKDIGCFTMRFSNCTYLSAPSKKYGIMYAETSNVSLVEREITDNKQITKEILSCNKLPTPNGEVFLYYEQALDYFEKSRSPLVVKPMQGSLGLGITVDVRTKEDFKLAWNYAKKYHKHIVVEELVAGADVRVLVIGGKAQAAQMRVPAHIVGDGKNTVKKLIAAKNRARLKNPRLDKKLLILDSYSYDFIDKQNHTLKSVPQKGEIVFLHLKANLSAGGDNIVITELINPDLLKLAEEAAASFGITDLLGIDMLVEDVSKSRDEQKCSIIEVNSRAALRGVQYPLYGKPIDAPRLLVEYLLDNDNKALEYPVVCKHFIVTGFYGANLINWIRHINVKYDIDDRIFDFENELHVFLKGREDYICIVFNELWSWKAAGMHVDGICVSDYIGQLPTDFNDVEILKVCDENHSQIPINSMLSSILFNKYENEYKDFDLVNINHALSIAALRDRGYEANIVNNNLVIINNNDSEGITGIFHSSAFADEVCSRGYPMKKILALNELPVARGILFNCSQATSSINRQIESYDKMLVTAISTMASTTYFAKSKSDIQSISKKVIKKGVKQLLVEEKIDGVHVCIPVVNGQAKGSMLFDTMHIVGDGRTSIEILFNEYNEVLLSNPLYKNRVNTIKNKQKKEIEDLGYDMNDILEMDEMIIFERDSYNALSCCLVSLTNTKYLNPDFYRLAEKAVLTIPGLDFAYVHLLIPKIDLCPIEQNWVIWQIETKPNIALFHFPVKGDPVNLVQSVVTELSLGKNILWKDISKYSKLASLNMHVTENDNINSVINNVKLYHDENERTYNIMQRFHYNSRMYLYTNAQFYCDNLYEIKNKWVKNKKWFAALAASIPAEQYIAPKLEILKQYREDSIEKHYKIKSYNKLFFRALFQEKVYDEKINVKSLTNFDDVNMVKDNLLSDRRSILILSTAAVNFLYHFNYYFDDYPLDPAFLLDVSETPIDIDKMSRYHAMLYFYTHAIVGASRFYSEEIIDYKDIYVEMLNRAENIVIENPMMVSLDQKYEIIVCSKLLNVESKITDFVADETMKSIAKDGYYIVDTINEYNNESNIKRSFEKSEHRNVLGIIAFYPENKNLFHIG